jgi:hypothetical protein
VKRLTSWIGAGLALLLILSIPGPSPSVAPAPPRGGAFAWNQDEYWRSLQRAYLDTRDSGCPSAEPRATRELRALGAAVDRLSAIPVAADAPALDSLERRYIELAPVVAACPNRLADYVLLSSRIR